MTFLNYLTDTRYRSLFFLIILYVLALLIMCLGGHYGFITKTVIVPFLFLIALISKQGTQFIKDWAIFLSLVILFDSIRGLIFALVTHFELPVYMNYVINLELHLGKGLVYPAIFQNDLGKLAYSNLLDRFFVLIYSSHFFAFLIFGMAIWFLRNKRFKKYTLSMLLLMYFGALCYLCVPTVPPWMAANSFQIIPPIRHISASIYNMAVPSLQNALDINPIAAMPSLHAAFPTLLSLIALKHFRKLCVPIILYTFLVYVTVIYLGDHYLVDILGGILLAVLIFIIVYQFPNMKFRNYNFIIKFRSSFLESKYIKFEGIIAKITLAMLIILISGSIGLLTNKIKRPFELHLSFIENELKQKSPVIDKILYTYAFSHSKFKNEIIQTSNFISRNSTYKDLTFMKKLLEEYPHDPEPIFWLTYFQFKKSILDRQQVCVVIDSLSTFRDKKRVKFFQRLLKIAVKI